MNSFYRLPHIALPAGQVNLITMFIIHCLHYVFLSTHLWLLIKMNIVGFKRCTVCFSHYLHVNWLWFSEELIDSKKDNHWWFLGFDLFRSTSLLKSTILQQITSTSTITIIFMITIIITTTVQLQNTAIETTEISNLIH